MIETQAIESQTRLYMYDLMNEAKEHGFNTEDQWQLSLVSEADKKKIQREYYPVIASKFFPELILDVFQTIKLRLQQSLSKEELLINTGIILRDDLTYIIAFNPKRLR